MRAYQYADNILNSNILTLTDHPLMVPKTITTESRLLGHRIILSKTITTSVFFLLHLNTIPTHFTPTSTTMMTPIHQTKSFLIAAINSYMPVQRKASSYISVMSSIRCARALLHLQFSSPRAVLVLSTTPEPGIQQIQ